MSHSCTTLVASLLFMLTFECNLFVYMVHCLSLAKIISNNIFKKKTDQELIPFEALSLFKDKQLKFLHIWNPFLDYTGDDWAQALRSGLCGLAWSRISRYSSM